MIPRAIKQREDALKQELGILVRRQEPSFAKQAAFLLKMHDEFIHQESMLTYLLGPLATNSISEASSPDGISPGDSASVEKLVIPAVTPDGVSSSPAAIAALLEDSEQLTAIRDALQATLDQNFLTTPYSSGGNLRLIVTKPLHYLASMGFVHDRLENDKFRGAASILHFNPHLEKLVQLSRVIMSADLPYFFCIKTASHAAMAGDTNNLMPHINAIGVSRYGVLPDRDLSDPINKQHTWMFSCHDETKKGSFEWRFDHSDEYIHIRMQESALEPRICGSVDEDMKIDSDFQGADFDVVGMDILVYLLLIC